MIGNYFFSSSGAAGYQIEQSLRFDGSSYMDPPDDVFGNEIGTYSFWVKRSELGAENTILWNKRAGDNHWGFRFNGADTFTLFKTASGSDSSTTTTAKFRDPSAWYHILVTTTSTANEVFVNGTSVATGSYEWAWIDANPRIGYRSSTSSFQGYLAEWHYISGSVKSVSDFTETDDNGVLRPIEYTGSYGTRGYYLKFDPSLTNGILHDSSGQGNDFGSSTGFSTTGTGTDVMSDTPTTNWCTLNPLEAPGNDAISDGNLVFSTSDADHAISTIGAPSGKFYCEVTCGGANAFFGLVNNTGTRLAYNGSTTLFAIANDGNEYSPNSTRSFDSFGTFTTGDIISFALDATNESCDVYQNNTKILTYDTFTLDGPYFFAFDRNSASPTVSHTVNFGQRAFAYTPPTGYKALNTKNLPAPDIADGSKHFNAVLWTGTGGTRTVTGYGFQPDFAWIKSRSNATDNTLVDVLRSNYRLRSNTTEAEWTSNDGFVSFASDGLNLDGSGSGGDVNTSGRTYVGWAWDAGGSGSSNTAGSITSTVSANPSAGFSIVTYTGTNANATVGHGLGVAPKMVICKSRNSSSHSWYTYHASLGSSKYLYLNLDAAAGTGAAIWNGDPTSTTFTLGTSNGANQSTVTYVAYCFAEVEGYSKFGYVSGLNNDEFVYLGFKPAWIMLKRTSTTSNWAIRDSKRDTYNITSKELLADSPNPENTFAALDFLSNGFKARSFTGVSGGWIYAAFAEHPTGGSGVSPATAR